MVGSGARIVVKKVYQCTGFLTGCTGEMYRLNLLLHARIHKMYTLYTRETLFMALACARIPAMAL
jgi:hypothetical protein